MTCSLEATNGLGRRVQGTIATSSIESALRKKLIDTRSKVFMDGFRKGRVPMNIIQHHHGNKALKEVLASFVEQDFYTLISEENIRVASIPKYTLGDYSQGSDLSYSIEFEIYPEFKLKSFVDITIEQPEVEITDADIDITLDTLLKQWSIWDSSDDAAADRDRVTLDFTGCIGNKTFEGGSATNFLLLMGQGYTLPDFESGIIGHKVGDKFSIDVKFPKDYHIDTLKDKLAEFSISLKKVEKSHPPELTSALFDQLGLEDKSVDGLRTEIHNSLQNKLSNALQRYLKNQAINALISANSIDLPVSLVEKEAEALRKQNTAISDDEDMQIQIDRKARYRVAAGLIVREIIRFHKLEADQERVKNLLAELNRRQADKHAKKNTSSKANKTALNGITNIVLEEQALDLVLKEAKATQKSFTFQELMSRVDKLDM